MGYELKPGVTGNISAGGEYDNLDSVDSVNYSNLSAESAAQAANSASSASASAATATTKASEASASATSAANSATAAANSATAAANSASSAAATVSTVENLKNQAAASATNSAATATTKANEASTSATASANSATAAADSALIADTKANEASASATASAASATASANSAATATTKANEASVSAAASLTSANNSAASATASANSATAAANSASSASSSATTATVKANEAATSATNSLNSANAAATSAANAANSETAAETAEVNAANSALNALNSETAAANSESNAYTSETNAANSASAAASSATAAANSASSANTSASAASSSATSAANSALAAYNSALDAAASAASIDVSGFMQKSNNLSDITDIAAGRSNLGLGSSAVLNAGVPNGTATLDAGGTVPLNQIPASIKGGVSYQGAWNASTNTPTIVSGTGSKGHYYVVSVAGNTNIDGITDWVTGDWIIFNGTTWEQIDNTDAVSSVNGYTGAVALNYTDVGGASAAQGVKADTAVQPNTTPTLTGVQLSGTTAGGGLFSWDDGNGTAQLTLKGGNSTLQLGQETLARVYNDSGVALTDGQIVYISGSQGNRVAVKLAKADSEATSAGTLGMVTEPIAVGAEGFITILGTVNRLNTSGLTAGSLIYLSASTAGAYTTVKPTAPNHGVIVGYVERVHATVGSIYVKVDNGYELDELHNVVINTPSNGQTLVYDAVAGVWENSNITAGTGISVTNGAGSITVSNTAPNTNTNISITHNGSSVVVNSSDGTSGTINSATGSTAGVMSSTDKAKLDGIAANANNYVLPAATSTTLGGIELFSDTVQPTAANAVTSNASRTYGIQVNSSGQAVVNVPWTDTNSGGTVTSVSGTGSVSGLSLSGTVTTSGSLTLSGTLSASIDNITDESRLFNNMGQNHNTQTDFNSISDFGVRYVQGGTNGPTGVSNNQFYGFTLGLGNEYPLNSYASQFYWPREAQNADTYVYIRDREGGAWNSWRKIKAGYADSAGSATTADQIDSWPFRNTGNNSSVNADTIESNGITYYTSGVPNFSGNATDGALYSQAYSSSWQHQIAGDYRSGQIALRGKNSGTWQAWQTVLDSSNYTNWAVRQDYNTSLNSDTRNTRGVTRLYRRDDNSDYSVQTYWTGSRWRLVGYNGDTYHAEAEVQYANVAGNGGVTSVNGQTGAVTVSSSPGIGEGQSWQNQGGANNTTYTNTTGRTICVAAQCNGTGGYGFSDEVYVNGNRISYAYWNAAVVTNTYIFLVPPNHTWRVVFGTGLAAVWVLKA